MNISTGALAEDYFTGPYIGASGGASFFGGQIDSLFQQSGTNIGNPVNISLSHSVRKNSFTAAAYTGFGYSWNNVYLGAELFADVANRNDADTLLAFSTNGVTNVQIRNKIRIHPLSYGIDFRPGYEIWDCSIFYARLGLGFHRVSTQSLVLFAINGGGGAPTAFINSDNLKAVTRPVFRMGLGYEQALMESLSFRIDYIYTNIGKYLLEGNSPTATSGAASSAIQTTTQTNLINHAIMAGLAWRF